MRDKWLVALALLILALLIDVGGFILVFLAANAVLEWLLK